MTLRHPRQPTRREVLAIGAAAVLGAAGVPGCAPTGGGPPTGGPATRPTGGFIDAHSHVWTADTARFPLKPWTTREKMDPPDFPAERLLALAEPHGVDRVVLVQHAPYYGDDNSYPIDCARRFPGRFAVVAIVDERRDDLPDHLRRLQRQGVRGLRIGPARYADRTMVKDPARWLEAPAMRALWARAAELDLVLCPLVSADYLPTLDVMLTEFADTAVAIDHFGHAETPDDLQALVRLARHRRVHVKASGFYKFGDRKAPYDDLSPMIRRVVDAFGPDRVLWGSDCPYQVQAGNNYGDAVALVERGLDFLSPGARTSILRDNSRRLFFG